MIMSDIDDFRIEIRSWLEKNCPASQRQPVVRGEQVWGAHNGKFPSDDAKLWFERCLAKGYTVPDWPTQYGGAGLSPSQTKVLKEEMKALGCRTPLYDQGIWMLGPALLEFGNEEQRQTHLPRIAKGETRWCQGYSEPGSGSDLASLQCRADDMGDHFLVNGAKIWTTWADKATWIFCLVRTNFNTPKKQDGISFLLIDMSTPGISTAPIELISGESEFCQTFFDDVKVPKENLVGELDHGWSVAKGLLKHERKLMSEMGSETVSPMLSPVQAAREYAQTTDGKLQDPQLRGRLVQFDMGMRALGLTHFRSFEEKIAGVGNGNIPLLMKYLGTEAQKEESELRIAAMGMQGLGWEGEGFSDDEILSLRQAMFNKALSIAGGTSEVQLNIIAKRALGLPDPQ